MKIRTGFVSNSSSASFLAAVSSMDRTEAFVVISVDLKELMDRVIQDVDDLRSYMKDKSGAMSDDDLDAIFDANEYWAKEYQVIVDALDEGKSIIVGTVGNESGDALRLCMYHQTREDNFGIKENGDVEILHTLE